MPDPRHRSDVRRAIRRYCAAHPNAADTVEGVHQWWLGGLVCTRAEVERCLGELVARGELFERALSDGSVLYGCKRG